jgi:hypothetical protein
VLAWLTGREPKLQRVPRSDMAAPRR